MTIYRPLHTPDDFHAATELTMRVWEMDGYNAPSPYVLHVAVHTGGCLIGAFADDDTTLIGYVLGFASHDGRLWSHIAAVDPVHQGQGIGYELKQKQRTWAAAHGYKRISWTFDPLLRRNANFNFNYLGVRATLYHVNFYGVMSDGLNAGFESDRLEVDWDTDTADSEPVPDIDAGDALFILSAASDATPAIQALPADVTACRIMIPYDTPTMKAEQRDLAQAWQAALRQQFTIAFDAGFAATGFEQTDSECWYVLTR